MTTPPPLTSDTVAFWQGRYDTDQTPWDLGGPAPPLISVLQSQRLLLPQLPASVAVLGAGRGHDAALFTHAGYRVTAMDFSPGAIAEAARLYPNLFATSQLDVLQTEAVPQAAFDMVVEHTCFCAIPPRCRQDYVASAAAMLKPGGVLLGLFWTEIPIEEGGPPYGTPYPTLLDTFAPRFNMVWSAGCVNSAQSRQRQEVLAIFKKR